MKVISLTKSHPGVRYGTQLRALEDAGVELINVGVRGFGTRLDTAKRQLRMIRRKGLRHYARRRIGKRESRQLWKECIAREEATALDLGMKEHPIELDVTFSGFNRELLDYIGKQAPRFILQAGVGLIPAGFVRKAPPIANIHPGVLPGIRGVDPVFWAHYYGRSEWLGTTLHWIDEGIDTGPAIDRTYLEAPRPHFTESTGHLIPLEYRMVREFIERDVTVNPDIPPVRGERSVYKSHWFTNDYRRLETAGGWHVENHPGSHR